MSVLISKCKNRYKEFSKELFTEINDGLEIVSDEEWEARKDSLDYKKVLFVVYVRTDTDNLVLIVDSGKFARVSDAPPFILEGGVYPNILNDSGLMCGKSILDSAFRLKSEEALHRLVANSTCFPVGAVETSKKYVVVFNIVISADLLKDPEIVLNQGYRFHPIQTLSMSDSLQKEISKSLIVIRK